MVLCHLLTLEHVVTEIRMLLLALRGAIHYRYSRALHSQPHTLRLSTTMHLEAAHMNQVLHVSLARPRVHSGLVGTLAHISSHHLLLEVVRNSRPM